MDKKNIYSLKTIVKPNIYTLFFHSGEVVEVRGLGIQGKSIFWSGYARNAVFGYFNDEDKLLKAVHLLDSLRPHGVYFTLNPVKKDLLARANNRLKVAKKSSTTADKDIQCVRWLPVDIDPVRPAGISSSSDEVAYALDVQKRIVEWIKQEFDIDAGILAMSGNGAHILVRIQDTDPEIASPIIKQALQVLSTKFSDDKVNIDQAVYNPARIWKAYGTVARKGDNVPERPHRKAIVFDTGIRTLSDVPVNPLDKIKALASFNNNSQVYIQIKSGANVDIQRFLEDYQDQIELLDIKDLGNGAKMYRLAECVFAEEHTTVTTKGDSGFVINDNGKVCYQCFHDHCQDKTVYDALKKIAGENYTKYVLRKDKEDNNKEEIVLKPLLRSITEYKPEEVEWLWHPYLPKGKIILLEGDPGSGKTWIALYICCMLIRKNKSVIYCTAEDNISDTISNRINIISNSDIDSPIDLSNFYILEGLINQENQDIVPLTLKNKNQIEEAIKTVKPALVVFDPVQGFLGGKIDINKANEVRENLSELVKLGNKYGCSFILVRHLNKTNTNKPIYKGLGSIDFSAIARSILLVGQKDKQIILTQHKNSLGEIGKSLAFKIENGRFLFVGEVNIDSEDILDQETSKSALEEAKEFLLAHLEECPEGKSASFLFREAKKNGISKITLKRAKKELNIQTEKVRSNGKFKEIIWKLPEKKQACSVLKPEPITSNFDAEKETKKKMGNDKIGIVVKSPKLKNYHQPLKI